jgi:hypothetical protein
MSPPAFRATFPGVAYQLGNVGLFCLTFLGLARMNNFYFLDGIVSVSAD